MVNLKTTTHRPLIFSQVDDRILNFHSVIVFFKHFNKASSLRKNDNKSRGQKLVQNSNSDSGGGGGGSFQKHYFLFIRQPSEYDVIGKL